MFFLLFKLQKYKKTHNSPTHNAIISKWDKSGTVPLSHFAIVIMLV